MTTPTTTKTIEVESTVKPRKTSAALPKKATKNALQSYVRPAMNLTFVVITVLLLYKIGHTLYNKKIAYDVVKKDTTCPTLLSISRSARDTLLVMKAEELCTVYVLDNIK